MFGIGGVFVIGIGAIVLGAVLMLVYSRIAPPFFRGETLRPGTADLLLDDERGGPHFGLPDSDESTVIAPDRSNLPPGQEPSRPASRRLDRHPHLAYLRGMRSSVSQRTIAPVPIIRRIRRES